MIELAYDILAISFLSEVMYYQRELGSDSAVKERSLCLRAEKLLLNKEVSAQVRSREHGGALALMQKVTEIRSYYSTTDCCHCSLLTLSQLLM